jgi:DNA-binding NarL/FixJ family response regulator
MKALVITDHAATQVRLRHVLAQLSPAPETASTARLSDAINALTRDAFDLVVFDLDTPGANRAEGACLLLQLWPGLPLAALSAAHRHADAIRAFDGGVREYLLKSDPAEMLQDVFRRLLSGAVRAHERHAEGAPARNAAARTAAFAPFVDTMPWPMR